MANVLVMPARELRHPVALFVLVVAGNRSLHEFSVSTRSARASEQKRHRELRLGQLLCSKSSDRGQRLTRSRGLLVGRALRLLRYGC
jgi:hypothetical protein